MLDKSTFIKVGHKKKYKALCDRCATDRGFISKENTSGLCYSCALYDRNKKHNWSIEGASSIVRNGVNLYKSNCSTCGKDRGYVRKSDVNKSCGKCACQAYHTANPTPVEKKHQARLRRCVKNAIVRRMNLRSLKKSGSITKILLYSIEELKHRLESKFKPGMSWENYGQWEIDHIVPDSWFTYTSAEDPEFQKSWDLNNLQPLWREENRRKSNKYAG